MKHRRPSSYRARVLTVVDASPPRWFVSTEIATHSKLTYEQTIYALNALHNLGQIARKGAKRGARWGSLTLVATEQLPKQELHSIFHSFVTCKPRNDE